MSKRWMLVPVAMIAIVAVAAVAPAISDEKAAAAPDSKAAFEKIKGLAGTWEGTGAEEMPGPVTSQYRVTGGGSAVVETLFPGTPHEMVTVYHMDGPDLVMTHYCAVGNQPRMKLDKAASKDDELYFAYAGGSNVDPAKGMYMHDVKLVLGGDKLEEDWTSYKDGKKSNTAVFKIARKAS